MSSLLKSKVVWTSLAGVATAVGAYFSDELTMQQMMMAVFAGLYAIFNRHSQMKAGKPGIL